MPTFLPAITPECLALALAGALRSLPTRRTAPWHGGRSCPASRRPPAAPARFQPPSAPMICCSVNRHLLITSPSLALIVRRSHISVGELWGNRSQLLVVTQSAPNCSAAFLDLRTLCRVDEAPICPKTLAALSNNRVSLRRTPDVEDPRTP